LILERPAQVRIYHHLTRRDKNLVFVSPLPIRYGLHDLAITPVQSGFDEMKQNERRRGKVLIRSPKPKVGRSTRLRRIQRRYHNRRSFFGSPLSLQRSGLVGNKKLISGQIGQQKPLDGSCQRFCRYHHVAVSRV